MVQVYRDGAERKIEVSNGKQLLKLKFTPDHTHLENQPSEVTGTLFEAGRHHEVKQALLAEAQGKGKTEKEALLDLMAKLLKEAASSQKEALSLALENIQKRIVAEGLGFSAPRYIPHSERA